jgi:hypothetical protein
MRAIFFAELTLKRTLTSKSGLRNVACNSTDKCRVNDITVLCISGCFNFNETHL